MVSSVLRCNVAIVPAAPPAAGQAFPKPLLPGVTLPPERPFPGFTGPSRGPFPEEVLRHDEKGESRRGIRSDPCAGRRGRAGPGGFDRLRGAAELGSGRASACRI